jgi:transposase-like protein
MAKAVLSHRISNTMDSQLVMSVLNDALEKHPHPEIFNTDQGSQYTSETHTKRLKDLGVVADGLFSHHKWVFVQTLCDVIFDGLLGVVCPWFVIQATSINIQSLTLLIVKQVNTTIPIKAHKKYSYKLRGLGINHANQVWSTDITYIKIAGGMVYMAAIIDESSMVIKLNIIIYISD